MDRYVVVTYLSGRRSLSLSRSPARRLFHYFGFFLCCYSSWLCRFSREALPLTSSVHLVLTALVYSTRHCSMFVNGGCALTSMSSLKILSILPQRVYEDMIEVDYPRVFLFVSCQSLHGSISLLNFPLHIFLFLPATTRNFLEKPACVVIPREA